MNKEEWAKIKASNNAKPEITFIPFPQKYSSRLHKKFDKLEKMFDEAEERPAHRARLMKSAQSALAKIEKATKPSA